MSLKDQDWDFVYESRFDESNTLAQKFHEPLLKNSVRYDRLTGYLTLPSIAESLKGTEYVMNSDTKIRLVVSTDLKKSEVEGLFQGDTSLTDKQEKQLSVISELMEKGRLEIKVAVPSNESSKGIFHAKVGIATDKDGSRISFEGSINETEHAWKYNYERFKIHRSWIKGEEKYAEADGKTFEKIWNNNHEALDVIEVSDAVEEDILRFTPSDEEELKENLEDLKDENKPELNEAYTAEIMDNYSGLPNISDFSESTFSVDLWPHQKVVSKTLIETYPENIILSDEVGLGKTIEIGSALSKLIDSNQAKNILLLVPGSLAKQWQREMWSKFNIYSLRYGRDRSNNRAFFNPMGETISRVGGLSEDTWSDTPIGKIQKNFNLDYNVFVVSWHTAKKDGNRSLVLPRNSSFDWDAVVVDEAHRARSRQDDPNQLHNLLSEIQDNTTSLYPVTATPMQTHISDAYDLFRLCDLPDSWDKSDRFAKFYEVRERIESTLEESDNRDIQSLINCIDEVTQEDFKQFLKMIRDYVGMHPEYYDSVIERRCSDLSLQNKNLIQKMLGESDSMFDEIETKLGDLMTADTEVLDCIIRVAEATNPVESRMFRNTRKILRMTSQAGIIDRNIPQREVTNTKIELDEMKDLYEKIKSDYIDQMKEIADRELSGGEKQRYNFMLNIYRQRLTSSTEAVVESLRKRRRKLENNLSDEQQEFSYSEQQLKSMAQRGDIPEYAPTKRIMRKELEQINTLSEEASRVLNENEDPKMRRLHRDLRDLSRKKRDSVLVFSKYEDTIDSIKDSLTPENEKIGIYTGQKAQFYDPSTRGFKNTSRGDVKGMFKEGEIQILLCTDAASEGLNLQSCGTLINYDLPWNPMNVEQRIGRIDRIGQDNNRIQIINYGYKDSIDMKVYQRLEKRINMFEDVVGRLRPVLDGVEKKISRAYDKEGDSEEVAESIANDVSQKKENVEKEMRIMTTEVKSQNKMEIIRRSSLEGWDISEKEILESINKGNDKSNRFLSRESIEYFFLNSSLVREEGFKFNEIEVGGSEHKFYEMQMTDNIPSWLKSTQEEQSVQSLGGNQSIVITFDPKAKADYPSSRLLLPRDPIYSYVINSISTDTDMQFNTENVRNREIAVPYTQSNIKIPKSGTIPSEEESEIILQQYLEDIDDSNKVM